MATYNKLTHNACSKARPEPNKARKTLSDGLGLKLNISATSKLWRFDYTHQTKQRSLSLGKFPEVSLAEARELRDKARRQLRDGRDPVRARQEQKRKAPENTFRELSAQWLSRGDWSQGHTRTIDQRLNKHVLPYLGDMPVSEITTPLVREVLKRIEDRGTIETAHRVKYIIGQICRFAASQGLSDNDPTTLLRDALKKSETRTFASISDPIKLGEMLRAIDVYSGSFVVKTALQLLPMVFVRSGELRGARWDEVDLIQSMWVIPAHRMKRPKNGPHKVPLSSQAVNLLRELHLHTGNETLLFPSATSNGKPISENTLNAALVRLDISREEHVPHGFRHTASTLLNEQRYDSDLIEIQLHHGTDGIRGIYNKAEYLELRQKMMQEWSDYLETLKQGGKVIRMKIPA